MAWIRSNKKGSSAEDGNDIYYPVVSPSASNKLYKESDVSAIATAIGKGTMKISEMASAISSMGGGLISTVYDIHSDEYTQSNLEAT